MTTETISLFEQVQTERWVSSAAGENLSGLSQRRIQQLATDGTVRTKPHPANKRWTLYNQADLVAQKVERKPDDVTDITRNKRRPTRRPSTIVVEERIDQHSITRLAARIDQLEASNRELRNQLALLRANAPQPDYTSPI